MQTILSFNQQEVKEHKGEFKEEFKIDRNRLWIDLVDPTPLEIENIQQLFKINKKALDIYFLKSKKIQIQTLDNHSFAIMLDIKYQNLEDLATEAIYFFVSKEWLITIHSSKVDLMTSARTIFEEQKKMFIETNTIDYLYYNMISGIVKDYEQLLTSMEMSITNYEKNLCIGHQKRF